MEVEHTDTHLTSNPSHLHTNQLTTKPKQSAALAQSLAAREAELASTKQRLAEAEAAAHAPSPAVVDSVGRFFFVWFFCVCDYSLANPPTDQPPDQSFRLHPPNPNERTGAWRR